MRCHHARILLPLRQPAGRLSEWPLADVSSDMRTLLQSIASFAVVGLALLPASCDRTPPTTPERVPGPAQATTVSIVRLEIAAPASLEPGASTQLKATAVKSDGSLEDVTARAQWTSSNTSVAQISAAGVITGAARGDAMIGAAYMGRNATRGILVLPNGTFKLSGQITDTGVPLANARIEILSGIGEGQTAITSTSGFYVIYGVAGDVRLQAKREGYRNQTQDVSVSGPHTLNLAMALDGARQNLAGLYGLAITAACHAGSTLPESARIRAYDALVEQDGPRLIVRLSGAPLTVTNGRGDHFKGILSGSEVTFNIGDVYFWAGYYYGQYDLVERFSATQTLTVSGVANATSGVEGISGTMLGTVALTNRTQAPFVPSVVECSSSTHRFEMRRR